MSRSTRPPTARPPEPAAAPSPPGPGDDQARGWAAVIVTVLVLGGACTMLLTGHEIHEALLLAGGVMLLGAAISRRILADGGLLPTVAIAAAVGVFALILLTQDLPVSDVAMACGSAGLITGEVTAWILRSHTPRRGV